MQKVSSNSRYLQDNSISVLSFSKSGEYCAIGMKKTICVRIYRVKDLTNIQSWQFVQQLKQHTQTIADIDWANDDKIITSSHDRSAVVWRRKDNRWEKMLVNIDIKLSILSSKWAPSSKKFALGSSCQSIAIGFYNTEAVCWTASTRQKFTKSPITSLCFHSSSNIIAVGSTDNSITIVSCSFKKSQSEDILNSNIEDKQYNGPFKNVDTLFEILFRIEDVGGWVNYISFENQGTSLLVLPHTNHIKIYQINQKGNGIEAKQIDIKWNKLPFLSGFIADNKDLYLGGFDRKVALFKKNNDKYQFKEFLEKNQKTNKIAKKGLVSHLKTGIQKKSTLYGENPNQSQHQNFIRVTQIAKTKSIVSYDINGSIHTWL